VVYLCIDKMEKIRVVFTGGGTGGHVYPNIAIYERMKEQYPDAQFLYIGTKKGAESRIVKNIPQPIDFVDVLSMGLPQNIKSLQTLVALFYIFLGTIKSYFILKKFKPDIIVGSGGYVAAPVLFAASILRLKVFIHEQNAVPGRLNRFVAKFASRVGVSFASTTNFFPEDKVVVTGYPLRKSIRYSKGENIREKFNIPEKNKVVFIFGGSGGSRTINSALAEIIPMLLAMNDLTIILSTGRGYSNEYKAFDDTLKIFNDIGIPSEVEGRLIIREYFDNIDEIYSISDLVVSRAGAGTIKEITTLGIPAILIPKINLPGDHQILNAREVEKIGGAKIVYETVQLKDNKQIIYVPETVLLNTIKEILLDSDTLFDMRKKLRQVEKHNSTELILNELELLMKGNESAEESQLKVFYLQSLENEKNIELIFNSTTVGNSYLCDAHLEGIEESTIIEFRIYKCNGNDKNKTAERIVVRRLKGHVSVDGVPVNKWLEIKEDNPLVVGKAEKRYVLKSYLEKVQKVPVEKTTPSQVLGSSWGMMFSRLGGMIRDIVIAAYFGASRATDIFAIALTFANFMRRIVAENALENAFLPIFSRIFHRTTRKKTWEASSSIVNFTLILSMLLTGLLLIFTPLIIQTFFPALAVKAIGAQTIKMTRLILPYLVLITVAAVLSTYLKAFNQFSIADASSVFFSIGTIIGIVVFYSSKGIYSLAYGVLLSGFMQILFLIPFTIRTLRLKSLQFSYTPTIKLDSPFNKKYYSQLGPISMDVFLSKTTEIVTKILATGVKIGSVAYLHFALAIYRLPFAVISQAINAVVLKEYSEKIALFDKHRTRQLFLDGIKTNVFLLTPVSVLMIVLAHPIISLLFERGQFNSVQTMNTANALQFYAIGLVGWGIQSFTARIFTARIDTKTATILNCIMLLVNIGLSIVLVKTKLTFAGLALATSISFLLSSFIRVLVLKKKLEKEDIVIKSSEFLHPIFKTFVSTLLMVIVLVQAKFIFHEIVFRSKWGGNLALLISLSFIGTSVYLLTSLLLKNTELLIFRKKTTGKGKATPISMLSPFKFIEQVSKNSDLYIDDYFYKINIYLSSSRWEIRNIGIKLIGLFKDTAKVDYLVNLLESNKENGFVRRNALHSLRQLNPWNPDIKKLLLTLLLDSYYEVRVAALQFLVKNSTANDFTEYKEIIHQKLKRSSLEEKLACLKLIAKIGDKKELDFLSYLYLRSNSLVREELLELLHSFYRRKLITADELREHIGKILITSNNLSPEFKLKLIIKKIYKEIE